MAKSNVAKTTNRSRWVFAIVLILAELPSPVFAEWLIGHDKATNIYSASSDYAPVELYQGEELPTKKMTQVAVVFVCQPSKPTGMILIMFKEAVEFADLPKPLRAELGYKVYGEPYSIGVPVKTYHTPVRPEKELPRVVAVSSGFRKALLRYVESTHDDRKHVLALYFQLKSNQIAFTENISLEKAKLSIRAAQKMCE